VLAQGVGAGDEPPLPGPLRGGSLDGVVPGMAPMGLGMYGGRALPAAGLPGEQRSSIIWTQQVSDRPLEHPRMLSPVFDGLSHLQIKQIDRCRQRRRVRAAMFDM